MKRERPVDCTIDDRGYRWIEIDGHPYRSDHVAFLYVTGKWPRGDIEHINGNNADDRWANLREVPNAAA